MVQQQLDDILNIVQTLSTLYYENKHEEFVLTLCLANPYTIDLIISLGLRNHRSDLTDVCREVLFWFNSIYVNKRFRYDELEQEHYINFTLRNIYDMVIFDIILNQLLYLRFLNKDAFCKAFEKLPECIFDKIDDLRETSYKTRDSDLYKHFLTKSKFISFEYFTKLKNYDIHTS